MSGIKIDGKKFNERFQAAMDAVRAMRLALTIGSMPWETSYAAAMRRQEERRVRLFRILGLPGKQAAAVCEEFFRTTLHNMTTAYEGIAAGRIRLSGGRLVECVGYVQDQIEPEIIAAALFKMANKRTHL